MRTGSQSSKDAGKGRNTTPNQCCVKGVPQHVQQTHTQGSIEAMWRVCVCVCVSVPVSVRNYLCRDGDKAKNAREDFLHAKRSATGTAVHQIHGAVEDAAVGDSKGCTFRRARAHAHTHTRARAHTHTNTQADEAQ